jgi:predicted membrane-bound mannosyltransferase
MKMTPFAARFTAAAMLLCASAAFSQQAPQPPSTNAPPPIQPAPPIPANAPHAADIKAARAAAEAWIQLLDSGRFDQAYEQMGQAARAQISQDEWKARLKTARARSGKLESRIFQNTDYTTQVKGAPVGQYVVLEYICTFATHDTARETIVMAKNNMGWHVAGFAVD